MAEAQQVRPTETKEAEPPSMNQFSLENGNKDENNQLALAENNNDNKQLAVAESPIKEKLVDDSPPENPTKTSPGKTGFNEKAQSFGVARSKRVEHETQTFIDSEIRKAEAAAEKQQSLAEKTMIREEANAQERLKREEQHAEQVDNEAGIKAERIVAQAKDKAAGIKANAKEECEKHIAEAHTNCEREKATAAENKTKKIAEIKDQSETMLSTGVLAPVDHKRLSASLTRRLKHSLVCGA